jgi:uncharacterized protein
MTRFILFLLIYNGLCTWFATRYVIGLGLSTTAVISVVVGFIAWAWMIPLTIMFSGSLPTWLASIMYPTGGYAMLVMFHGLLLVLLLDLTRFISWMTGSWFDPLWSRPVLTVGTVVITIALVAGTIVNARAPRVSRFILPVHQLPIGSDGITIAHISDLHIGLMHDAEWLERIVTQVNELQADLVVLTGDIADGDPVSFRTGSGPLVSLHAKYGVYAVNGNHEHFGAGEAVAGVLAHSGIRLLRNESVEIRPGLWLAGIEDISSRTGRDVDNSLDSALAGIPTGEPVILLSHQPQVFPKATERNIRVQLSGHTHGGQYWPWEYVVKMALGYVSGLYTATGNDGARSSLVVSNGTGTWGPPVRLGARHEILFHVLHPARIGVVTGVVSEAQSSVTR